MVKVLYETFSSQFHGYKSQWSQVSPTLEERILDLVSVWGSGMWSAIVKTEQASYTATYPTHPSPAVVWKEESREVRKEKTKN